MWKVNIFHTWSAWINARRCFNPWPSSTASDCTSRAWISTTKQLKNICWPTFLGIITLNCYCVAWGLQTVFRTTFAIKEHFIRLSKQRILLQWHKSREINKFLKFWSSGWHPRPGMHSISIKSRSCYTQLPFNWVSRIQNNCAKFTEMPKKSQQDWSLSRPQREFFLCIFLPRKGSVALRRQNHFCRLLKCGFLCGLEIYHKGMKSHRTHRFVLAFPSTKKPTKNFTQKLLFRLKINNKSNIDARVASFVRL